MASLDRVIPRKCCRWERSTRTMATKEGDMRAKWFLVIAALVALTLGTAQNALADNNATGSTGAVQTGPVGVTPTAGASQDGTSAAVSAPVTVGGSGDNTATNSVGAVQAGGGNTSSNSTGTAQVSSASASPTASAGTSGRSAGASFPLSVGGNGSNTASNSTGAAQVGGGNTATGSAGTVQSGPVGASPSVGSGSTATAASTSPGAGSTPTSAVGGSSPGARTSEGAPRLNRNTVGVTKAPANLVQMLGRLPFTGLRLLMVGLLGLVLLATGLATRRRTRLGV